MLWYQVDRGDGDLSSFLFNLRQGLDQPHFRARDLPPLPGGREPDLEIFARNYFRKLFAAFPSGSLLVLDNWQEATDSASFVSATSCALEELPSGVNMVVLSRQLPPAPLLRHVANRQIAQLDWEDLKLREEEVAALKLILSHAPDWPAREIAAFVDGWVAGLVLLGETGVALSRSAPSTGPRPATFDYFAHEFFDHFDAQRRRVLMACSLLPSFTAEMAAAVTKDAHAGKIVRELRAQQLFVTDHGARPDFRFHPLFSAFLRNELSRGMSADERLALHRLAAEILLADRQVVPALDLLFESAQHSDAARVLLREVREMLRRGLFRTVDEIASRLPAQFADGEPWLVYWHGRAVLSFDTQAALRLFEQAFSRFTQTGDRQGRYLSAAGAVEAIHIEYDRQSRLDPWCDFFASALPELPRFEAPEDRLFVWTQAFTAVRARRASDPLLGEIEREIRALIAQPLAAEERILAGTVLLEHYIHASLIDDGRAVADTIERVLAEHEVPPAYRVHWRLKYGYFLRFSDVEKADRLLVEMREYAKVHGDRKGMNDTIQIEVMNALIARDLPRSRALIEEEARVLNPNSYLDRGFYTFDVACLALLENRLSTAEAKFRESLELVRLAEIDPMEQAGMKPQLASTLLKQGRIDEAVAVFEEARAATPGNRQYSYDASIAAARAHGALLAGDAASGERYLEAALRIGREHEVKRILGLIPDIVAELLRRALDVGIETDYARTLIRNLQLSAPRGAGASWPWPLKIYTLGRFEVHKDSEALVFSRKAPHRLLEALKALIALGPQDVGESKLADALWPDETGETGRDLLATTLHRLRKLLGDPEAIIVSEGRVSLHPERVWIDAQAFEQAVEKDRSDSRDLHALDLYRGEFLPADSDAAWSMLLRERLRSKFIRHLRRVGTALVAQGKLKEAIELYQRGVEADSLAEDIYQLQMRAYFDLGRYAEGLAVYRRLRQSLSVVLGISPSVESERLHRSLQRGAAME